MEMLNLNLMHINEHYQYPSELPDSSLEMSGSIEDRGNPSIKAVNLYQLNRSVSEHSEQSQNLQNHKQIDHSLDQSSIQNDDFLEMVQREQKIGTVSTFPTKSETRNSSNLLLVDRTSIEITLLQTQNAKQTVAFTNPTANPIRMHFHECPFQIQSSQMLGFILAQQLEVVIEPWDRVQLTFAIEPCQKSFGDIIENVVITGQFVGRNETISPVSIRFHVRYISPKVTLKYQGSTDVMSLQQGKIAVVFVKANKLGQYQIDIGVMDGIQKMEVTIETKGKISSSVDSFMMYDGDFTRVKLRPRGNRNIKTKERCGIIIKPRNTQICYILGVQLLV